MTDQLVERDSVVSRRTVVEACLVAGAVTLSGCTVYDTSLEEPTTAKPGGSAGSAGPIAATADVPVGGGLVVKDQKIVVTQPTKGDFKGFSAVCTHQGCVVATVADGTINCTCHGSKFSIEDGSVKAGPATKPLPAKEIKVDGDRITLA